MKNKQNQRQDFNSRRLEDLPEEDRKQVMAMQKNLEKLQKDEPSNLREHLQAINDGVIAIIITIIVLEIKPALHGTGYHNFLFEIVIFLVSFFIIADFWYDLHLIYSYFILTPKKGTVIANFAFLADLALLPVMTKWVMNEHSTMAVANFGVVFLIAKILEYLVQYVGSRQTLSSNAMEVWLTRGFLARGIITIVFNLILICLAFYIPQLVMLLYLATPLFSFLFPMRPNQII